MKKCGMLLLLLCILFCAPAEARAQEGAAFFLTPSKETVAPGEEFQLTLAFSAPEAGDLSAFRMKLSFDESRVQFRDFSAKSGVTKSELAANASGGTVTLVYLTGKTGLAVGKEPVALLTVKFVALSGCGEGDLAFSAEFDGACRYDLTPYAAAGADASVWAEPPAEPESPDSLEASYLRALWPDSGTLEPSFDPQCFSYALSVDYSVNRVVFYAEPADGAAAVKVNRKTLGAMGSVTHFTVTVTSPDKRQKSVYEIEVTRGQKPVSTKPASSKPSASVGGKTASRPAAGTAGNAAGSSRAAGSSPTVWGGSSGGKTADTPQTGEKDTLLSLPSGQGNAGAFFLGLLAAACVGGAVVLLFYRKKGPKEK